MRGPLYVLGMLAGCFAPSAPAGVPCDPAASRCPSGQSCVATPTGHVCSAHDAGVSTPEPDAAIDIDAGTDAAPPIQKTYSPTVAECINPAAPSPVACRAANGNAQLVIDLRDSTTEKPWESFVRFELDNALAGRTVTKVVLRLVVTTANNAPGPDSGSVFAVTPFTLASLSTTAPTKVGNVLAGSVGAIDNGDVVELTLPSSIAVANMPLYLGLFANDDDGVNYYNLDGTTPPRLVVDAQ